jgi:hypothetical protein
MTKSTLAVFAGGVYFCFGFPEKSAQVRMNQHTDPSLSRRNTAQGLQNNRIWIGGQTKLANLGL